MANPDCRASEGCGTGRDGTTPALKEGPAFEVLATNRLGEGVDASPVFAGRRLLLRGEKHLSYLEEAPEAREDMGKPAPSKRSVNPLSEKRNFASSLCVYTGSGRM